MFILSAAGFSYTPLSDVSGNPVTVTLGGETTLRLTALSAALNLQLNYLLLLPTTDPVSGAYVASNGPLGANVSGDETVRATVLNGSTGAAGAQILFDGADVTTQATVTPNASGFAGAYDPAGTMAPGSSHTVRLILADGAGTKTTNDWSFTVGAAVTLPTNVKTAPGTGVGSGFNIHIHKINNAITGLAHTAARAEQQLAGQLVDTAGVPYDNEALGPNGDGLSTNLVLNFQQLGQPTGYVAGDEPYPYIDPSLGDPDNIAMEATAYLDLAAGMYRFGVRSDDGFRLTVGPTFATATQVVGVYEGGRGDTLPGGATEFNVLVIEPGLYPARLIYYEGNGGASLEFYTVDPVTLKRTLVNAPDSPVKAYTARSAQLYTPTISITAPADQTNFPLNAKTNVDLKVDAAVQGATISKVEYFAGTNKVGEGTTAPFTFTWSNVDVGHYTISAKATDSQGFTAASTNIHISVGTPLSINFQAATATTPEGYLPDLGDVYGDRGNGHNYGWDVDNTANARERNNVNSPDKRYDTFNHMQKPLPAGRVWEIEVPNGVYKIFGASGDPTATDSVFDIRAEDVPFISGVPSTGNWFADGSATVEVKDGKLTLTNGPQGANNKINFIDIYALSTQQQEPPNLAVAVSNGNINVTWTGGGTLQYKTDIMAATWTDTGNSTGSFTETIPTGPGAKFFRVSR
jgi:hypothetical protein